MAGTKAIAANACEQRSRKTQPAAGFWQGPSRKRGLEEYGLKAERYVSNGLDGEEERPMPACANKIHKGKGERLGRNKGDYACRGSKNCRKHLYENNKGKMKKKQ